MSTQTQTKASRPQGPTKASRPQAPTKTGAEPAQNLSEYIQARFDECTRSQKDVAQYIVDHMDEAAFQTAEELARRANTSSSTVVRFAQMIGFEGFPELQVQAQEQYKRSHLPAVATVEPLFPMDKSDFESALAADYANAEETARQVSSVAAEELIDAITSADKLVIVGTDQMAFFASYLRHLLLLLGLPVDVVTSPTPEALKKLAGIDESTLVIGLSTGRPHPLVVRAMKLAHNRQAQTAAITDATLSDVAKLSRIQLYYSSASPAYVRSHTALLGLIQALSHAVYAREPSLYEERVKAFGLK